MQAKLVTLNISNNQLTDISACVELPNLKALIASSNQIKILPEFQKASVLNTLGGVPPTVKLCRTEAMSTIVLSHNKIRAIPALSGAPLLAKLSLSHNKIKQIPDHLTSNRRVSLPHD